MQFARQRIQFVQFGRGKIFRAVGRRNRRPECIDRPQSVVHRLFVVGQIHMIVGQLAHFLIEMRGQCTSFVALADVAKVRRLQQFNHPVDAPGDTCQPMGSRPYEVFNRPHTIQRQKGDQEGGHENGRAVFCAFKVKEVLAKGIKPVGRSGFDLGKIGGADQVQQFGGGQDDGIGHQIQAGIDDEPDEPIALVTQVTDLRVVEYRIA